MSITTAGQLQVAFQYCGSTDYCSNTCPQVEICSSCKYKNHNLLYICPLLRSMKCQEKDYRGYKSDDLSLGCLKMGHKIRTNTWNIQVFPVIVLPTSLVGPPEYSYLQDV